MRASRQVVAVNELALPLELGDRIAFLEDQERLRAALQLALAIEVE